LFRTVSRLDKSTTKSLSPRQPENPIFCLHRCGRFHVCQSCIPSGIRELGDMGRTAGQQLTENPIGSRKGKGIKKYCACLGEAQQPRLAGWVAIPHLKLSFPLTIQEVAGQVYKPKVSTRTVGMKSRAVTHLQHHGINQSLGYSGKVERMNESPPTPFASARDGSISLRNSTLHYITRQVTSTCVEGGRERGRGAEEQVAGRFGCHWSISAIIHSVFLTLHATNRSGCGT